MCVGGALSLQKCISKAINFKNRINKFKIGTNPSKCHSWEKRDPGHPPMRVNSPQIPFCVYFFQNTKAECGIHPSMLFEWMEESVCFAFLVDIWPALEDNYEQLSHSKMLLKGPP